MTPGGGVELAAAGAGELPAAFDIDADVEDRRRQVLGEVLQVARQVLTGGVPWLMPTLNPGGQLDMLAKLVPPAPPIATAPGPGGQRAPS